MTWPARRTIASHALAAVGMSLPWPLLVLLVWEQAGDGWVLGLAGAARMLPYVALSWAAGRLADRFTRDRIVRLTLVLRTLSLLAMAAALVAGQTWLALGAATFAVAVATPAYPALAAAMPGLAGRHTERATSLLVTCEVASFVVGPALGGLLLTPTTRDVVPWAAVLCVVAAWLLFRGVRLPAPVAVVVTTGATGVLAALRTSAVLRGAIAAVAVVNAVAASVALALLPLADSWDRAGGGAPMGRRSGSPPVRSASALWAGRCWVASAAAGAWDLVPGWWPLPCAWPAWYRHPRCGSPCRCWGWPGRLPCRSRSSRPPTCRSLHLTGSARACWD
jgi:MFS family permease